MSRFKQVTFERQHVWLGGVLLVIVLISAAAVILYARLSSVVVKPEPATSSAHLQLTPSPTPPPDPNRDRSFVLLGYGGGKHAGGRLTDTMMLAVIQHRFQRIVLVSLPRDIWVELPLEPAAAVGTKLNSAYSFGLDERRYPERPRQFTGPAGGGQLAKFAIDQVTGLSPEHFVAIDFDGFVKAIDAFGGVTVNVRQPFIDEWYPIEGKENETCEKTPEELAAVATLSATQAEQAFPCRYEKLEFQQGMQHLDGITALKFARSRHSNQNGGDLSRSARQRALLTALKDHIISIEGVPKLPGLLTTLSYHVTTDVPLTDWDDWLSRAEEIGSYEVVSLMLDDDTQLKASKSSDGQFILVSRTDNWESIHNWLQAELETVPTPDPTPKTKPAPGLNKTQNL